jgi:hypothetical protein
VLAQLRAEYFAPHRLVAAGPGRGKQSPHGAATVSEQEEKGWQAKVREELGISDDTARRWMLDSQRYSQMLAISSGAVDQVDGQKITTEVKERTQEALGAIQLDPTARPARLWAGLWGAGATKGKQRAAVDHARNIRRAVIAFATSLEHWSELSAAQRAEIEEGWAEVVDAKLIPSTWQRP